jgi:hypothetical protein
METQEAAWTLLSPFAVLALVSFFWAEGGWKKAELVLGSLCMHGSADWMSNSTSGQENA